MGFNSGFKGLMSRKVVIFVPKKNTVLLLLLLLLLLCINKYTIPSRKNSDAFGIEPMTSACDPDTITMK